MHTHPTPAQSATPASVSPSGERRLLLAVDAPSLLHRNHHARAHTDLRDRHGRPAWALHGMLRQILEAIDLFAPDAVIFGLDDRVTSQRERFYPDYKAGRAAKDATLVDQLDRAGALLDALGFLHADPARAGGRRRQRLRRDLGRSSTTGAACSSPPTATPSPTSASTPRCCG